MDQTPMPYGLPIAEERVKRATGLLRLQALQNIKNPRVTPRWLRDRDTFWYRRDIEDGFEFVLVDAATGYSRPAFDHAAQARALEIAAGQAVSAARLPVIDIRVGDEGLTIRFELGGHRYVALADSPSSCMTDPAAPPDSSVAVAPDGSRAVFVRDCNLWLRELDSRLERPLTADGTLDDGFAMAPDSWPQNKIARDRSRVDPPPFQVSWSPDSRRVMVPRVDQRHVAAYPFIENVPLDGSFRPKAHAVRLALMGERPANVDRYIVDLVTHTTVKVQFDDGMQLASVHSLLRSWWNAEGSHVFVVAQSYDLAVMVLLDIDAASGAVRTVLEDRSMPGRAFDGPGTSALAVRVLGDGDEAIWRSARDGWDHLYLYDIATGHLKCRITDGHWVVRDIVSVDEVERVVYFTASGREPGNPYHRYLYRAKLDGSCLTLVSPEPGDHLIVDPTAKGPGMDGVIPYEVVSPSGSFVAYSVSTVTSPAVSLIRRTADLDIVARFESSDPAAHFAAGYRPPEEFTVELPEGENDLHGLVYRPSDHDPGKKYAVIDVQYASPLIAATPRDFTQAASTIIDFFCCAATAELGFIVVVVDGRGTPNRSRSFSQPKPGFLATMGLDDHVHFIKALALHDPSVDLDRVAISGISFGGWTTLRGMLGFPNFYKVGIAAAAPGTFHAMYALPQLTSTHGEARYPDGSLLHPTADSIPEPFRGVDNVQQVDQLIGKLLLVVGEQDENVPPGSTLQFFHAALQADKDVELIHLPNATHFGIYQPYVMRKAWAFLLEHLNGTTLPAGTHVPSPVPGVASRPQGANASGRTVAPARIASRT